MAINHHNWGDIPIDAAQEIVAHLDFYQDCHTFSYVCSAWRSAVKQISLSRHLNLNLNSNINIKTIHRCQPPLLMLADQPQTPHRRFYSLINRMVRQVDLPLRVLNNHNNEKRSYFSSRGWLISLSQSSDQNTLKITVFNPFSGKVIEPPCISADMLLIVCAEDWEEGDFVQRIACHKFILSSTSQDDDLVTVAVIFDVNHKIGFWSLGQDRWVKPMEPDEDDEDDEDDTYVNPINCSDVCFHRGKFYAINQATTVIAFTPVTNLDNNKIINWCPKMVVNLVRKGLVSTEEYLTMYHCYLVGEWEQDLILVVCRSVTSCHDRNYFTAWIRVIEVNVETGDAREVRSLGNRTIFVGFNSTFFVVAPASGDERACKPNCIYFTDDNNVEFLGHRCGGGRDMGIYSLVERKVLEEQVYEGPCASRYCLFTPPIWVEDSQNFPFTLDC